MKMLLLVIALMYWCGKTMATTSGCYTGCPTPVETLPGEYYEIDCLLRGDCSSLMFFLNNRRLDEESDDNIFLTRNCGLGIHSLTSAYEGSYTCSYGEEHSDVLACISVLSVPRFLRCDGNMCTHNETAPEGLNHTLDFSIIYASGGDEIVSITSLTLSEPRSPEPMGLDPSSYNYSCDTKIRRVVKTLTNVSHADEGLYNMTITFQNFRKDLYTRTLLIYLTVTDPPTLASTLPMTSEVSSTLDQNDTTMYSTGRSPATQATSSKEPTDLNIDSNHTAQTNDTPMEVGLKEVGPKEVGLNKVVIVSAVAVPLVVLVLILVICGIVWFKLRRNKSVTTECEATTLATSRKHSDSSGDSSTVPFDSSDSVEMVMCEMVHPANSLKVGNRAPEEESRRQGQAQVAMKRGMGSVLRSVGEVPQGDGQSEGWTTNHDTVAAHTGTGPGTVGPGGCQHQDGCCSRTLCTRQCQVGYTDGDLPCEHLISGLRQIRPRESGAAGHQENWSTRNALANQCELCQALQITPHLPSGRSELQERTCLVCAHSEDQEGTLILVPRSECSQERQKDRHFHSVDPEVHLCGKRNSTSSNRTSMVSLPGDGNSFSFSDNHHSSRPHNV